MSDAPGLAGGTFGIAEGFAGGHLRRGAVGTFAGGQWAPSQAGTFAGGHLRKGHLQAAKLLQPLNHV